MNSQFNSRDQIAPTPGERCYKVVARILLPLLI